MASIIIIVNCFLIFKTGLRPLVVVKLVLKADVLLLAVHEYMVSLSRRNRLVHGNSELFIFVQVL